jgi:osmoprotectant transport system ATP-binding protein
VKFDEVTVRYGGRAAVDRVTIEIAPGSLTVLLGPSGSGKSTLLRTVNRLVEIDAGSVSVDGRNVREVDPTVLRRGIGYVIQAIGLFPHMTVAKNIAVVPELLSWDRPRIDARVDELLALVRLEPARYRDRLPRELSGGEAQRIGVARALAARPGLMLMDEPFGALDPIVRASLQDETLRVQRSLGTTFLFVTHDVDEALRIADSIVVLHEGRVVQQDTPLRVLARPANGFVRELFGAGGGVRKLGLIAVRDAMAPPQSGAAPGIEASENLRTALDLLLAGGPRRLNVTEDGCVVGSLSFEELRSAQARP